LEKKVKKKKKANTTITIFIALIIANKIRLPIL